MPKKTEREDPLGFFNIHSVAKLQKIEGGLSWGKVFLKKVAQCRKNGPFGLVRYCMLRGKLFWFSSLGRFLGSELLVELFWSVQMVLKNTDEKP